MDMYRILPLPSGTYNKGGIFFQDSNDLLLLILSIFFFCLGIYFTFFSKINVYTGCQTSCKALDIFISNNADPNDTDGQEAKK